MEESQEIPAIFERDLNPERIVRELAAQSGPANGILTLWPPCKER
jgi:hypothetical protein